MQSKQCLASVKDQYENYPYPPRDVEDEKKRLYNTIADSLELINFYCFSGKQNFNDNFRILVAGGGTGDATIYLAEQLRTKNASITHLDLSSASIAIAKERAMVRGLNNIEFINSSILDLTKLNLAPFDYINCFGVLHHLKDPEAGLSQLNQALKPEGCMAIMLYAKYGRLGVERMQSLMRLINKGEENLAHQVNNCKTLLNSLDNAHPLKAGISRFTDIPILGDAGIYDLLLHSQNQDYTVPQIYEMLGSSKLILLSFLYDLGMGMGKMLYSPSSFIKDPNILAKANMLSEAEKQAIAELYNYLIVMHLFYVAKTVKPLPSVEELDNIPFFSDVSNMPSLKQVVMQELSKTFEPAINIEIGNDQLKFQVKITKGQHTQALLNEIDGNKTIRQIYEAKLNGTINVTNQQLIADFTRLYNELNYNDLLLLRHNSVEPFKSISSLQQRFTDKLLVD